MKKVIQQNSADLEWIYSLASQLGGKVEGNYIVVPEEIRTGNNYFLNCGEGIVSLYSDVTYNKDFCITQKNLKNDFVGLYFNLSQSETKLSFGANSNMMGSWFYNLSLIDSSLEFQYNIQKGSKVFIFCIFIKKEIIKSFLKKNILFRKKLDLLMDPTQNTFIHMDRMSDESFHILMNLQKQKVDDPLFNLHMIGTTNLLMSKYLKKIAKNIIISQVNEVDLLNIIESQRYLIENLEKSFPGIKFLAYKAHMSDSKYKLLFKKITGSPPNVFYLNNKLFKAKELIDEKQLTIGEICKQLNFGSATYFAAKFKLKFGILPKTYSQQL
ncbi:AraC-type DNA-binding protein [Flavobacterium resistens]|uniref:AraC-type DNA-binding protein n=1 Tax=Flavobacterium resistens TaxID=443612 RepID=A0A521DAN3_9FLAO|nr:AraC family transcriptional regulator [Flavobacterium resistens]MRX70384.1 helix-turn-helix domain-containing protein [Flavobacterium resistens]SMO67950.1 AraC-type DNA-binding protein [Flavobacterium resistens]